MIAATLSCPFTLSPSPAAAPRRRGPSRLKPRPDGTKGDVISRVWEYLQYGLTKARAAGDWGYFPGNDEIALELGISVRSVVRALGHLNGAGLIKRWKQPRPVRDEAGKLRYQRRKICIGRRFHAQRAIHELGEVILTARRSFTQQWAERSRKKREQKRRARARRAALQAERQDPGWERHVAELTGRTNLSSQTPYKGGKLTAPPPNRAPPSDSLSEMTLSEMRKTE